MPEPTTADGIDILRGKVERWAPQGVSDVMCSLADLADLITAYDQQDNDLTALSIDVSDQSKRAREAEARAAAAEVRASASQRECATHKQAAVDLASQLAAAEAAVQRVRALVDAQGADSYVMSHALLGALSTASAPQPDLSTVSGIVNAAPDDQPVTVTGHIHHVEVTANRAGAPYVKLTLVDRDAEVEDSDPDTVTVVIPASVYAAMDLAMRPREGTLVEVTGRAVREVLVIASGVREAGYVLRNGEPVYDRSDEQAPPWPDWTEQDEAARTEGGAL